MMLILVCTESVLNQKNAQRTGKKEKSRIDSASNPRYIAVIAYIMDFRGSFLIVSSRILL